MTDEPNNTTTTKKRTKCCPSCREPVATLQLSAYGVPPEGVWIPWLRMVNQSAGWSIRGFGQTGMNELQFLCFTSVCEACGLISWWDLSPEELENSIKDPQLYPPKIRFTSNPPYLREVLSRLPDENKNFLKDLIDDLTAPRTKDEPKK